MSVVRIPTSPLPQRFLITLAAGQTYQMVTQYRDAPEAGWTLDIGEPDGTAIISGIPLVTGINLLAQYQHLIVGSLFVLSDADMWAAPGFADLGAGLVGIHGQGGCKVGRMLAGAAGDLQRSAGGGQQRQQLGEDGQSPAEFFPRGGGH